MKYEIVSYQQARGRGGQVYLRVSLARAREPNEEQRPTQQDAVISITDADKESPFWSKAVGDTVEIG